MRRGRASMVGALAFVLAACSAGGTPSGTTAPPGPTGEVRGAVVAGPVCPVETDPPDPSCADRLVAGATIVVTRPDGSPVAVATSDAGGHFALALPPGTYILTPQPVEGLRGTAPPVEVEVIAGSATGVDLAYDTGIRGPEGA